MDMIFMDTFPGSNLKLKKIWATASKIRKMCRRIWFTGTVATCKLMPKTMAGKQNQHKIHNFTAMQSDTVAIFTTINFRYGSSPFVWINFLRSRFHPTDQLLWDLWGRHSRKFTNRERIFPCSQKPCGPGETTSNGLTWQTWKALHVHALACLKVWAITASLVRHHLWWRRLLS